MSIATQAVVTSISADKDGNVRHLQIITEDGIQVEVGPINLQDVLLRGVPVKLEFIPKFLLAEEDRQLLRQRFGASFHAVP